MEDGLYTREDIAERWKCSVSTIKNYEKDGILKPCQGIPLIRFTKQHILGLEGVKLDRLSPLERRRLENENKALKEENKDLKIFVNEIISKAYKLKEA